MKADLISSVWRRPTLRAAILFGLCAQVISCHSQSRQSALVGKPAPGFRLEGIYDETYFLDQFKGHILVMQFGSSW